MFQLLQPIWLWASAAIIFPVAIHLWNIKQRKVLKIGSIFLFENSTTRQSKSLQINEWLLLLLRCLLLIIASLLLAKPQWQQLLQKNTKGWILLSSENINETYNHFKPSIDSLLKADYEFHYFENNFPKADFTTALKEETKSVNSISYLSLSHQLQQQLPTNTKAVLFTDNYTKHFQGKIFPLQNIDWHVYTSKDSVSEWVESVYQTYDDSVKIIKAKSNSLQTTYSYQIASFQDALINKTTIDTSTLSIGIYAVDNFKKDAEYLKSAILAVKEFSKRKIKVQNIKTINREKFNWLFYLSEKEVDANINAENIFSYASGKEEAYHTTIFPNAEQVRVYKHIVPKKTETKIWADAFGNVILSKEKNIYHFYSRFQPSWSELVWSNQFPSILYSLLYPPKNEINKDDKRTINEKEIIQLVTTSESASLRQEPQTRNDISKWFWFLLVLIFVLERWLSSKRKK